MAAVPKNLMISHRGLFAPSTRVRRIAPAT